MSYSVWSHTSTNPAHRQPTAQERAITWDDPTHNPMRGIAMGLCLVMPFWGIVGYMAWTLLK